MGKKVLGYLLTIFEIRTGRDDREIVDGYCDSSTRLGPNNGGRKNNN
jgi:hypothetical protein